MSTEIITTGASLVTVIIDIAKLLLDMEKYPDKKFEKILNELKKHKLNQENLVNILLAILRNQRCETMEVTRLFGIYEKKKRVIRNHFV